MAASARPGGQVLSSEPLVSLREITCRFGPVVANDRISLDIHPGSIHGLVGENGAGKSTLMRVLYGLLSPDSGNILFQGRPVRFRSPRDALALGIGMVHQHFMLVPDLPVLDNVILGDEPCRGPFIDRRAARRRLAGRAGGALEGIELDRPAGDLPVGLQQKVEILKLLYRDVRLLILDEPTAVLSPGEIGGLFQELRRLAAAGRTVVLITHKLGEVLALTDAVSVLRRGRLVATHRTRETTADQLAREIVGSQEAATAAAGLPGRESSPPVLELRDVVAPERLDRGGLRGFSLSLRGGEIVAVVGVEGNGQSELAQVAAGRRAPAGGSLLADGVPLPPGSAAPGRPGQVGYIPEDRHREGFLPSMSVADNLILGRHREARFRDGVFLDEAAIRRHAERLVEAHDVRPGDVSIPMENLSGGNQQKAVVAREVEASPRLIVATHPTRGLDLRAAAAVHRTLSRQRVLGQAVLLITADLDEARSLADRIVVIHGGRAAGELRPDEARDETLGLLMTGGRPG